MQTNIQIGNKMFSLSSASDAMEASQLLAKLNDAESGGQFPVGCSIEEMVAITLVLVHLRLASHGTGSDYVVSERDLQAWGEIIGLWAERAIMAIMGGSPLSIFAETISQIFGAEVRTFKAGDGQLRLRVKLF